MDNSRTKWTEADFPDNDGVLVTGDDVYLTPVALAKRLGVAEELEWVHQACFGNESPRSGDSWMASAWCRSRCSVRSLNAEKALRAAALNSGYRITRQSRRAREPQLRFWQVVGSDKGCQFRKSVEGSISKFSNRLKVPPP